MQRALLLRSSKGMLRCRPIKIRACNKIKGRQESINGEKVKLTGWGKKTNKSLLDTIHKVIYGYSNVFHSSQSTLLRNTGEIRCFLTFFSLSFSCYVKTTNTPFLDRADKTILPPLIEFFVICCDCSCVHTYRSVRCIMKMKKIHL